MEDLAGCYANPFWATLDDEARRRLVEGADEVSYAEGTVFRGNFRHPVLLLSGILYVTIGERPNTVIIPGDLTLTPHFRPATAIDFPLSEAELRHSFDVQRWHCVTPVSLLSVPTELVEELLGSSLSFARATLNSQLDIQGHMAYFQDNLYHYSAYEAVRYILKLGRSCGLRDLTHAQIAFLSGRNRTTVTKTMHEIALAEPELLGEGAATGDA